MTTEPQKGYVPMGVGGYADVVFTVPYAAAPTVIITPVVSGTSAPNAVPHIRHSEVTAKGFRVRGLSMMTGVYWHAF